MSMKAALYQVDSFTSEPFKGNPAGVCILQKAVSEPWMQKLAMEMNLAETAFIYPVEKGYHLRWFTPLEEVELCGHATLATAHMLFETGRLKPAETARFQTISGELSVIKKGALLEMNFPATPAKECPVPGNFMNAFENRKPLWFGKNDVDYLIEFDSEDIIRDMSVDLVLLKKLTRRGVIITARSENPDFDFISRFFAPAIGIDEDPVTGSAHCTLAPYWMKKLDKKIFNAYQASQRGGHLQVEVKSDRILLRGQARTVFYAELSPDILRGL